MNAIDKPQWNRMYRKIFLEKMSSQGLRERGERPKCNYFRGTREKGQILRKTIKHYFHHYYFGGTEEQVSLTYFRRTRVGISDA